MRLVTKGESNVGPQKDEPGSKISLIRPDCRLEERAARLGTRLRSSRIILRARTFLASTLTAGPRSHSGCARGAASKSDGTGDG